MARHAITPGANTDLTRKIRYVQEVFLRESAGAVARSAIRDGGVGGTIVCAIPVAASGIYSQRFDPPLFVGSGVFVDDLAGSLDGFIVGY